MFPIYGLLFAIGVCAAKSNPKLYDGKLPHSTVLDEFGMYNLFWAFDDISITFEVQVRTLGYIGLGFSPHGGMTGADIIIGWVDSAHTVHIKDFHGIGNTQPELDEKQDVHVIYGSENSTHTTLRFVRSLDTCDKDDWIIKLETIRLIWSFGMDDPSDMDISYHGHFRGSKSVILTNPTPTPTIRSPPNSKILQLKNEKVSLPEKDTYYWCQSFQLPKIDKKHHIIKLEPDIEPGHEALVHHIIIYGCFHDVANSTIGVGHECYNSNMPDDFWDCNAVLFAWAVGGTAIELPSHVGVPIGMADDPQLLVMETHYDNPSRHGATEDSSGMLLTYTPTLRQYDAGVIQMGSIVTRRQVIPPYVTKFTTRGDCLPECTEKAFINETDGIHIIGVTLHSHLMGRAMRLRHFRNGHELPMIVEETNYDFNLQQQIYLSKEVTVLPGDSLVTECDYDSSGKIAITMGGLSTSSEMCLSFPLYYPRINLTECATAPSEHYLQNFINSDEFGYYHWTFLYPELDWANKTLREQFQDYVTVEGKPAFVTNCRKALRTYLDPDVEMSLPRTLSVLSPPENTCPISSIEAAVSSGSCLFPGLALLQLIYFSHLLI